MRSLLISLPPAVIALLLLVFFCAVCFAARGLLLRRCGEKTRDELADQARDALTGVAATFAFFVGFAISVSWGAVSAAQSAVEQQAAAIQQMAWELRNIPEAPAAELLLGKLQSYATTAAEQDVAFLARGVTTGLPSTVALEDFETALQGYLAGKSDQPGTDALRSAASKVVSSASTVAAVASRALPHPLIILLFVVAILVSAVMGVSTVTYGRPSLIFVWVWCLIPALSLTVVLALAYPFALRTGLTTAPMRMAAQELNGG